MKPIAKTVTNEDILELLQESMQMTGEGFERLEGRMGGLESRMGGLEGRMDGLEGRMDRLERQYSELKITVDKIAGEQQAQKNDIKEILDRICALEKKGSKTDEELQAMRRDLDTVVAWAHKIAQKEGIALKVT